MAFDETVVTVQFLAALVRTTSATARNSG